MVSVIIPNYNGAYWLEKTINSCLEQGAEYLTEIIIVDDGSTDNSWELLSSLQARHPEEISLHRNPDKGANTARNYGYSVSKGKYIQWLDADDQIFPGKWAAQVAILENQNAINLVYSDWYMDQYYDGQLVERRAVRKEPVSDFLEAILRDDWSVPANYLMSRELAQSVDDVQGWYPNRLINQDREYFTMAGFRGAEAAYVPGFFSVYNRWGEHTKKGVVSKKRHHHDLSLILLRFHQLIGDSHDICQKSKKMYHSIIHAQLLALVEADRTLELPFKIGFNEVDWRLAGRSRLRFGFRLRYRMLKAFMRQYSPQFLLTS